MKLSEIITHIEDFSNHPEGIPYLIISKYEKPHVDVISRLLDNNMNDDDKMIFKSDKVNIEFLSSYLKLNMHLLKEGGNIRRTENRYILDHLTPEFIANIEIPELPSRKLQDTMATNINTVCTIFMYSINCDIQKLFDKNNKLMLNHEYPIVTDRNNGSDLFKVTNVTLFFRNIIKGNLNEPYDYINNLRPELVTLKYLVYYLHYSKELLIFNHYESDINEFNGSCLSFKLPSIDNQMRIINTIEPNHAEILELKNERKSHKTLLRKLINAL